MSDNAMTWEQFIEWAYTVIKLPEHIERVNCPECGAEHGHALYCSVPKSGCIRLTIDIEPSRPTSADELTRIGGGDE